MRSDFFDERILAETASEILGAATPNSSAAIEASLPVPFCSALSTIKFIRGFWVSLSRWLNTDAVTSIRKEDNSDDDHSLNILAISTSEIKISVLIHEKHTNIAVKSLHHVYNL